MPEVGGPIDPDNEVHELIMSVFGGMSKGERNRIKARVRTAMASQSIDLDGPLRDLVARSLDNDPAKRPTARELVELLLNAGSLASALR